MQVRRRRLLVVGIVTGLSLVVGAFYLILRAPERAEPSHGGKSLTRWLRQLDDGQAFGISSGSLPSRTPAQVEAAEAIRAMGVEALPVLMQDIHASPSPDSLRLRLLGQLNQALRRVTGMRISLSLSDVMEEDRVRWRAAQGLAALGPLARPAIPELRRLLFTNYFHSSIKEAAYVLAAVGPEGLEILTNAVQPQSEWSGMCAIWALGQHPAVGTNAIPFLIQATSSTSEGTACGALQVLGMFHADAEHVIPALTNALASANPAIRRDAAWALGEFRAQAAPTLALLGALTNDSRMGDAAQAALNRIQGR